MCKKIFLTLAFCLFSTAALAAPQDFGDFSLDLGEGWQMVSDPIKNQGATMVIVNNPAKQSAINLTYAPTNGEDAKALAEGTVKNMEAAGVAMNMKIVKADANYAELQGAQGSVALKMLLLADPAGKAMATVVVSGDLDAAASTLKTIKFKNNKLALQ